MSSVYSKNEKELSGVKVVPASKIWQKNGKKYQIRKDIDVVGKVEISMSNFILKANNTDKKTDFIDDVSSLPKRTKSEIVSHFYDKTGKRNKNSVAYLVRTDKKSKIKNLNQ